MKAKKIGLVSATFLGISSIMGSGWLFAPYHAAQVAGPASIFSWIIGAFVILLLAMCFAEIAALYPKRGLSAIIPTLSHNKYFGFPFAIANWLGIVAVVALEAAATIQYLINLAPQLTNLFFSHHELTTLGLGLATLLVIVFCFLNYWGTKLLTQTNNILSIIKLIIPIVVGLVMISVAFHPQNFTSQSHTMICYGYRSIFSAILTTGIIISFNGFQTVISFSSEIKKPARTIPISLILSIVICLLVYVLLQTAFIGSMPTSYLHNGWGHLHFNAPMIELAGMIGLGMFTSIIYFSAIIGPCGTAIAFTGAATRMFTAMSRNKQMPKYFDKVDPKYSVSRPSLILNAILSVLFLCLFRSWGQLAQVLSLFHIVSYLPIPIALIVFRNAMKGHYRSFLLPGGRVIALCLFIFFTYLFTMGSFNVVLELMVSLLTLYALFIIINIHSLTELKEGLKKSFLITLYFIYLIILAYISPHHMQHMHSQHTLISYLGLNKIHFTESYYILFTIITSSLFFYFLTRSQKNDEDVIHSAVNIYQARKEHFSENNR